MSEIANLTSQLETAVKSARAATPGGQRAARERFALSIGVRLKAELEALTERLNRGWDWLEANRDDPTYLDREERWLTWLKQYERSCDVLSFAERELLAA